MSFRDGCFGLFMTDRTQELRWTGANSRCCGFRQCNGCTGKSVYEMLRRVVVGKEKISMSIGKTHGGCSTCPTVARVGGEGKVSSFFPATHHIKQNGYFGPLNGDLINVIWIGKLGMFTTNSAGRMT